MVILLYDKLYYYLFNSWNLTFVSDQTSRMPSIEQCDAASGSVAALPSTLEIFDKFKPIIDNGKDSDSEESFHLLLEDDDVESMLIFDIDT